MNHYDVTQPNTSGERAVGTNEEPREAASPEAVRAIAADASRLAVAEHGGRATPVVVEQVEQEVMAHVSSDGRSPDHASRHRGQLVLVSASLFALGVGAIVIIIFVGGTLAIAAAIAYTAAILIAGLPVWGAGLLRKHEEDEVKREVTVAMRRSTRRGRSTGNDDEDTSNVPRS